MPVLRPTVFLETTLLHVTNKQSLLINHSSVSAVTKKLPEREG